MSWADDSMNRRSMLPSGLLGVPTATKVKSVSRMAFSVLLIRHLRLPF